MYKDNDKYFFELKEIHKLGLDSIAIYNFLEKLQLIFTAKYNGTLSKGDSTFKSSDLSEGQYQMIKILSATGLCKSEDALVLLDEPDAHMNPKWKYNLKSIIDTSLKPAINTQAIISTHDPLVINGVDKKFIRIFDFNKALIESNNSYTTKVHIPNEDTQGMGIDGLLQSQYYGLQTSYDKKTSDMYLERQQLYIKLIGKDIKSTEKERLKILTKEIGSFPVANNTIDFLYDDFIMAFRNTKFYSMEYLEFDQLEERRQKIKEIVHALYEDIL